MGCQLPLLLPLANILQERFQSQLINADAVGIIKLRRHFEKVRQILSDLDLLSRAKYIERATAIDQKIIPIESVNPRDVPYFSMILVPSQTQF